jgi:hypothetical protein
MKKANDSRVNDSPIASPKRAMNAGHSSPNSIESTVPETAPTAKSTATALDQRRASAVQRPSPVRRPRHSAHTISHGIPTPSTAKMIWKDSDSAICSRAAVRSSSMARAYFYIP